MTGISILKLQNDKTLKVNGIKGLQTCDHKAHDINLPAILGVWQSW